MTEKQTRFVKHLLGKRHGYYSEEWGWLGYYSIKQAGKLIDKLLKPEWSEWVQDFITKLPPPTEKPRRQAWLPLPDPEPLPLPPDLPPEQAEWKRWAREVFQRGERTMEQLCILHDQKFGKPAV